MAYVRKPKVFKVTFDDSHQFAGLTLQTRSLRIAEFASFGTKLHMATSGVTGQSVDAQLAAIPAIQEAVDETKEMFADVLISWNMEEEDGTPTPTTIDGVGRLDDSEFLTLLSDWLTAIGGVGEDLGKDSGSIETSPELSALMEPLSPSLVS